MIEFHISPHTTTTTTTTIIIITISATYTADTDTYERKRKGRREEGKEGRKVSAVYLRQELCS